MNQIKYTDTVFSIRGRSRLVIYILFLYYDTAFYQSSKIGSKKQICVAFNIINIFRHNIGNWRSKKLCIFNELIINNYNEFIDYKKEFIENMHFFTEISIQLGYYLFIHTWYRICETSRRPSSSFPLSCHLFHQFCNGSVTSLVTTSQGCTESKKKG